MPKLANVPNISILSEVETASRALAPALKRLTKALGKLKLEELVLNSPGAAADLLYDLRQTSKLVPNLSAPFDDVLEPHIKSLEEHFIQRLEAGEASGVQGARSRVQVTVSAVPSVEDWAEPCELLDVTRYFEPEGLGWPSARFRRLGGRLSETSFAFRPLSIPRRTRLGEVWFSGGCALRTGEAGITVGFDNWGRSCALTGCGSPCVG